MRVKFSPVKITKNFWKFEPQNSLVRGSIYIPKEYMVDGIKDIEVNIAVEPEAIKEKKLELSETV